MTVAPVVRLGAALVGAFALLGLTARPAGADPPRPTDYRSTILDVSPALPVGAEVRIVGGDSLVELSLPRGHTAVVADYPGSNDDEPVPYLRFDADGTVRRNVHAVATTANEARYGSTDRVPDPNARPRWETVATDGSYAWHDHRIHWMSPTAPRAVDEDGRVDLGGPDGTWTVPLVVDGTPTVIEGQLVLEPAPAVVPWALLALAAVAATLGAGVRWGLRAAAAMGAAAGAAATLTAVATWQAVPAGAGASVVPVVVAAVALVSGVVAMAGPRRFRLVTVAATAAALLGWGITRGTVLTRAVLPTTLAPALDRGVTASAMGVGLGLAVLLVAAPSRKPEPPHAEGEKARAIQAVSDETRGVGREVSRAAKPRDHQPAAPLAMTPQERHHHDHRADGHRVARRPAQLGHVGEVHPPHARQHGGSRDEGRPRGDRAHVVVLANAHLGQVGVQRIGQEVAHQLQAPEDPLEVVVDVTEVVG